jgi:hypothetical protein
METIATLDINETTRLAAYLDHGSYNWNELTGEGVGIYTLNIARNLGITNGGQCTDDLDRLTRYLDRGRWERAIGLYMHLSNRTYKTLALRGYSQGEWADIVVYADAGSDGEWLNSKNATADIEAWFRGDIYTVAIESLETYVNAKNGDTLQRWEITDSCGMVTLSNDYTLADAGRDIFGSDAVAKSELINS